MLLREFLKEYHDSNPHVIVRCGLKPVLRGRVRTLMINPASLWFAVDGYKPMGHGDLLVRATKQEV